MAGRSVERRNGPACSRFSENALSVATWDAQFSPDGRYIASANTDGVTKLWAVQPGEPDIPLVTEVAGDGGAIKALAFSPSGAQLATAAADGKITVLEHFALSDRDRPRP